MGKRITWNPEDFVSLKLRSNLYTIGQMLNKPAMQFFDKFNHDGNWGETSLRNDDLLFKAFISTKDVIKDLAVERLPKEKFNSADLKYDSLWIKPYTLTMDRDHYKGKQGDFPFLGGKIVDLGTSGKISTTRAPVIQEDLTLPTDRELIERIELTNMWSSASLNDRLCRFFDTGIDRDDLKFEIFPGLWNDREKIRPLTCRLPIPFR
ncbi:hypothetical protein ACUN9Y_19655 [Halomonas sp. V046]|uniref:hypothetical protein n=1 Tax=Halomonas sp. V046 TaxID=3459611 RepID=UPI0040448AB2